MIREIASPSCAFRRTATLPKFIGIFGMNNSFLILFLLHLLSLNCLSSRVFAFDNNDPIAIEKDSGSTLDSDDHSPQETISTTSLKTKPGMSVEQALEVTSQFVDEKLEAYRVELQGKFSAQDCRLLLKRKETLDWFLAPTWFLRDLNSGGDRQLLGSLCHDYSGTKTNSALRATAESYGALKDAMEEYRLKKNAELRFQYVSRSYSYTFMDYPVVVWVQGAVSHESGHVATLAYEPLLLNRCIDFPLHPNRTVLAWDSNRCELHNQLNQSTLAARQMPIPPNNFDNAPIFYDLFDGLQAGFTDCSTGSLLAATIETLDEESNESIDISISRGGDLIQTQSITLESGKLRDFACRQFPLQLLHLDSNIYKLRGDIHGKVTTEDFRPQVHRPYLNDGRSVQVAFEQTPNGASMPKRFDVTADEIRLHSTVYLELEYGTRTPFDLKSLENKKFTEANNRIYDVYKAFDSHLPPDAILYEPTYYTPDELRDESQEPRRLGALKARLKYNIFAALLVRDYDRLLDNIERYQTHLERHGIQHDMYVYSIEGLTQLAFNNCGTECGREVVSRVLIPAYQKCNSTELRFHVGRLIHQNRLGFALVALESLQDKSDSIEPHVLGSLKQEITHRLAINHNNFPIPFPFASEVIATSKAIASVLLD